MNPDDKARGLDAKRAAEKGAKTNDVIHHDDHPGVADHVGEAAGGISGVLAGAAIGSAAGPIGTVIGGIAGAVGGWWSGRAVSEAATKVTTKDDEFYRAHYEKSPNRMADRGYDDVRPAYQLGHIASMNPDYANKDFDTVEPDLRKGWSTQDKAKFGEWNSVRGYAKDAYARGRSNMSGGAATSTATGAAAYGAGKAVNKAESAGRKVANAADDMKDRVDGNPASKPGPDATDKRY